MAWSRRDGVLLSFGLRFAVALATGLILLTAAPTAHAIEEMTRQEIISLAQSGLGYSYWWGNGSWRQDGKYHGSCAGSCPRCTHYGSYGADCSGYVAKVWQVPTSSPVSTNSHPYSTYHFRNQTNHWTRVNRADAHQADALVYRSKSGGHIFLYDRADPWGVMWAYECKSCRAGCVHNLRSAGSTYVAIRRNSLIEPPQSCTQHDECSSGLCAWNGDMYCCRSPGFSGEECFSDSECGNNQVCAFNGDKFVCTSPVDCGGSGGTGGSGGSSGSGGVGASGGGTAGSGGSGVPPGGCGGMINQPYRPASLGSSTLLLGIAAVLHGVRSRTRRKKGDPS